MDSQEEMRSKRRMVFARAYLLLVILIVVGIGGLWFHGKAVPDDLGTIVGLVVGGVMSGLGAIIKFHYGEEAAQSIYKTRGENDEKSD